MDHQENAGSYIVDIIGYDINQYWNGLNEERFNEQMLYIPEVREARSQVLCFLINAAAAVHNLHERGYDIAKIMPVEESLYSWLMVMVPETVKHVASIDKLINDGMPIGDPEG